MKKMKCKSLLVFAFIASVFMVSCDKGDESPQEFSGALPESKGTDELAGKTFSSSSRKYVFSDDGTVVSYTGTTNYDTGEVTYKKDCKYAYSCDSENKTLSLAPRGWYEGETLYTSVDEYYSAFYENTSDNYSDAYKNLKIANTTSYVYEYSYSLTESKFTLAPKIASRIDETALNFSKIFNFSFSGYASGGLGIWPNGLWSWEVFFNAPNENGNRVTVGNTLRFTEISDSTVKVAYVSTTIDAESKYSYDIIGYGTMIYSINKISDTEGTLSIKFSDIDESVLQKFEESVAHLKEDPGYAENESSLKEFALVNTEPMILDSNSPEEFDVM